MVLPSAVKKCSIAAYSYQTTGRTVLAESVEAFFEEEGTGEDPREEMKVEIRYVIDEVPQPCP